MNYENIVNIVEDSREVAWADQTVTSEPGEVEPLDAVKNAENNLSLMKTNSGNHSNTIVHWNFSVIIIANKCCSDKIVNILKYSNDKKLCLICRNGSSIYKHVLKILNNI